MPVAPPDVHIDDLSDDFTEAQWTESKRLSKQLCAERGVEAAVDKELDSWREERIWRSSGGKSKRTRCGWGFRFSCLYGRSPRFDAGTLPPKPPGLSP